MSNFTTAPAVGDMDKCDKKPRCKWGEHEGQSLPSDPLKYCPTDNYTFREDYCDCESSCVRAFTVSFNIYPAEGSFGCDGDCYRSSTPVFSQELQVLPNTPFGWKPTTSFVHYSTIGGCPGFPAFNTQRTPESYGVDGIYFSNGNGVPEQGGYMSGGSIGTLYQVYEQCGGENPRKHGVWVWSCGGGSGACMIPEGCADIISIDPIYPTP